VIYTGSGAFATSSQMHALRRRALSGDGGRLAHVEHTAERPRLEGGRVVSTIVDPSDRELWWESNPTLGERISEEFVEAEFRSLPMTEFLRERLAVWEPEVDEESARIIPDAVWLHPDNVAGEHEVVAGAFGVHVTADGRTAAVSWAAADGERVRIGVLDHRPGEGTGWLVPFVADLHRRRPSAPVVVNPRSDAGPLVLDLERVCGEQLVKVSAHEFAAACGQFRTSVEEHSVCYRRQQALEDALRQAGKRPLAGGWAWDAPDEVDITAVVSVTLALHGFRADALKPKRESGFVNPWGEDD
jgi:hypothetical protein